MWIKINIVLRPYEDNLDMSKEESYIIYEHIYDTGVGPARELSLNKHFNINTPTETREHYLAFYYPEEDRIIATSKNKNNLGVFHINRMIVKKWIDEKFYDVLLNIESINLIITIKDIVSLNNHFNYKDMINAFNHNIPDWVDDNVKMTRFALFMKEKYYKK